MCRCTFFHLLCVLSVSGAGGCEGLQSGAEETAELLEIDTPDKGYLHLPVRITDRSTAAALSFDPRRDEPARISYRLTRDGLIRIRVVWRPNPSLVLRTLLDWTHQGFGLHSVNWDGRDASGNLVDNRNSFISFEGDEPSHLAHPAEDCHELGIEILSSAAGTEPDLSGITARLTRATQLGRESGFSVRCYLDYALQGEARLEGGVESFALPCDPKLEPGDHLLTVNVEDGAGHVGVASLHFHYRKGKMARDRGRELFFEEQCHLCHDLDSTAWRESGPGLLHIGSRRPAEYLRRVIEAPRAVNRTSRMPEGSQTGEAVEALVEYLMSLQRPAAAARTGIAIYREEGCADCHETTGEFGAMAGPALQGIGRLRTVPYLEAVVLRPGESYPRTAMPPTRLPPQELANLLDYLRNL